jgi:hypothetical protein
MRLSINLSYEHTTVYPDRPVNGALAGIAILYSIYALYYTRRQEQRNACFRLLELWSSDYYSQCRNEGWYESEALTSPIETNDLYKTPEEADQATKKPSQSRQNYFPRNLAPDSTHYLSVSETTRKEQLR